jgi:hypothetical protein
MKRRRVFLPKSYENGDSRWFYDHRRVLANAQRLKPPLIFRPIFYKRMPPSGGILPADFLDLKDEKSPIKRSLTVFIAYKHVFFDLLPLTYSICK